MVKRLEPLASTMPLYQSKDFANNVCSPGNIILPIPIDEAMKTHCGKWEERGAIMKMEKGGVEFWK